MVILSRGAAMTERENEQHIQAERPTSAETGSTKAELLPEKAIFATKRRRRWSGTDWAILYCLLLTGGLITGWAATSVEVTRTPSNSSQLTVSHFGMAIHQVSVSDLERWQRNFLKEELAAQLQVQGNQLRLNFAASCAAMTVLVTCLLTTVGRWLFLRIPWLFARMLWGVARFFDGA
jgi:hypothetical protein